VLGYKSLFDKKIIHRDIKPANILISSEKEGELLVKVKMLNNLVN
jgi:serine/threonine protein kinase